MRTPSAVREGAGGVSGDVVDDRPGAESPESREQPGQAGRRWYGPAEIRQLAIIRYWQTSGLMSLDQISDILAGPEAARGWTEVVEDHMETLGIQLERMAAARAYLEHILAFHRDSSPDGCPHYESLIWEQQGAAGSAHPLP